MSDIIKSELEELNVSYALSLAPATARDNLGDYLFRKINYVEFPVSHTNYTVQCKTQPNTNSYFGEITIVAPGYRSPISECYHSIENHYGWETHWRFRNMGLGNITRTLKEARDGILDFEEVTIPSLAKSLHMRGYEPTTMSAGDFQDVLGEDPDIRLKNPVLLKLCKKRVYERLQKKFN